MDHKFIFLDDHLDRFFYSASRMHLATGQSRDELKTILYELSAKNNIPDSGIRITLTGGYSGDGYTLQKPNLIITQKAMRVPGTQALQGIRLVTYEHQRQLPDIKTIDYLMAIWLKPYIVQQDGDDVLYHTNGIVTECPRANIFAVTTNDIIITPGHNILRGITRKHVIDAARQRYAVEEKDVSINDILRAKEVFITSTTKQLLPVLKVDGRLVNNGKPGEIITWLNQQMSRFAESIYG